MYSQENISVLFIFRLFLSDFLYSFWGFSREFCIFQQSCRKFYQDPCMDLSIFIPEHHSKQCVKRSRKNRCHFLQWHLRSFYSNRIYFYRRTPLRYLRLFTRTAGKPVVYDCIISAFSPTRPTFCLIFYRKKCSDVLRRTSCRWIRWRYLPSI